MEEKKIVRSVRNEDKEKGMKEGRKEGEGWRSVGRGGLSKRTVFARRRKRGHASGILKWRVARYLWMDVRMYVTYVHTYVSIVSMYMCLYPRRYRVTLARFYESSVKRTW